VGKDKSGLSVFSVGFLDLPPPSNTAASGEAGWFQAQAGPVVPGGRASFLRVCAHAGAHPCQSPGLLAAGPCPKVQHPFPVPGEGTLWGEWAAVTHLKKSSHKVLHLSHTWWRMILFHPLGS
jgi:hypothetical protein